MLAVLRRAASLTALLASASALSCAGDRPGPVPAIPDEDAAAPADVALRGADAGDAAAADSATSLDAAPVAAVDVALAFADAAAPVSDPGKEGDGNFTVKGPYVLPPEATLQPGVTAGKVETVMVTSKIFPGRDRVVTVYMPAGYAGAPAPFIVLQDGPSYINNFKLPTVLDNMIAKKQLPAMVAIFVPNGGSNRSFEYDSLTDLYVRFVLEEVLPAVEKGLPVKLTSDPEGRAAGGHSSGGIAAFTMGWHRPDQFRRLLTHSGSFVNIRGGNKVPGMVMMGEPKPLRVFLSVGSRDLENGRWQTGNEMMAAALAAKQYHYRFVLMEGGTHQQGHPASILPETLLWLWRGYPVQ